MTLPDPHRASSDHAFLFDLDGTLVLTDHLYCVVWRKILEAYHIDLTPEMFTKYIQGNSDDVAVRMLLPNIPPEDLPAVSRLKDTLFCEQLAELGLVQGSVQFVKRAYEAGHKVAIVTNCNRKAAESIIQHIGLEAYVDLVVIGAECERPKPHPDPYNAALAYFGITHERAVIFEDSRSGLLSALGVYPKCIVGIATHLGDKALRDFGADLVISDGYDRLDMKELLEFKREAQPMAAISRHVYDSLRTRWDLEGPGCVQVHDQKLKGGYIADVVRLELALKDGSSLPCVLKLQANNDSNLNKMAGALDLYGREFYFYESISPYINISIPKFYGIVKDADLQSRGILLENLNRPGFHLGFDLNKQPIGTTLRVIDRLADLHARFWDKDLGTIFPLLRKNDDALFRPSWPRYVQANWAEFEDKWASVLSPKQLALGRAIVAKFDVIQEYLSQGHLTLCHGDVKSANIFFRDATPACCAPPAAGDQKEYEPYFIDWQYIAHGKGVQDLVFFMIESFEVSSMQRYNILLKHYYYAKLTEHDSAKAYDKNTYMLDFQLAACYYPLFVAVWFGVTPKEHLIDVNFPFFFNQRLFSFLEANVGMDTLSAL